MVGSIHPLEERPLRPALVLWGGYIGGAESFTADLARAMQAQGAEPGVVFVLEGAALSDRLDRSRIPHSALKLRRGRSVVLAPRRLAQAVAAAGTDVAILVDPGYLAAALRGGGFRGPIIGIEHGSLLQVHRLHPLKRVIRSVDRLSGMKACSAVVAVSRFMRDRVERRHARRRIVCIPNGVDLERFTPSASRTSRRRRDGEMVVGCAARLVDGKGIEDVLQALKHPSLGRARLRIAGDGPRQGALKGLAGALAIDTRTEFLGPVVDMPAFWRSTDVAVVPSNESVESFGMSAVEAMACAKPVVVSNIGALPDVVADGATGRVVSAGDVPGFARALGEYARDPALRDRHGLSGRQRCAEHFAIERTASRYLELCAELVREAAQRK
jgi:glycosyltransferase involved in cell wall biosynthesis